MVKSAKKKKYRVVVKIKNRLRKIYLVLFIAIFILEIIIALFVHDSFVRPYIGDVLVTVLICGFLRMIITHKFKALPVFVFLLSALVEIGQYFDFVKILGFDDNTFISTLFGRTYSFADIICYGVGCVAFAVFDFVLKKKMVVK